MKCGCRPTHEHRSGHMALEFSCFDEHLPEARSDVLGRIIHPEMLSVMMISQMAHVGLGSLDTLTRHDNDALRALLIAATAASGRPTRPGLDRLVAAAPVELVAAAAVLHRVAGSVLDGLGHTAGIPAEVTDALALQRRRSAAHHLVITRALGEIARAWDAEGIRWVVMKGPVAATLLYSDAGNRTYGDLDLLVARTDLARATEILEHLGYVHEIKDWARAERVMAGEFAMAGPTVQVDLHWHLLYSTDDRRPFRIDPEVMLGRARTVTIAGCAVPTFDDVDTLLTLAFHAARSDGHRLIWLKDIERSITVERPDLDELVSRSHAFRCAPPVGIMLGRASRALGADVPEEITTSLTGRALRIAERVAATTVQPVQLHEQLTSTRFFTRSVKSSIASTVEQAPRRAGRWVHRRLTHLPVNETSDPRELASFMTAVARADLRS
jgi:Uncharacterised nucleotidyltransferase